MMKYAEKNAKGYKNKCFKYKKILKICYIFAVNFHDYYKFLINGLKC